jgi:hypothetical protein
VTEIIRKLKTKPRTSSISQNDENKRPSTASRSGVSLKHSTDSHNKDKELHRNSSYGRFGAHPGHETERNY